MAYTAISPDEFAALAEDDDSLRPWRYVLGSIAAEFRAADFGSAAGFASRVAVAADDVGHHPDLAVRYPGVVTISVTTHDAGGSITNLDVDLASTITRLAEADGDVFPAPPTQAATQTVEFAIDTIDPAAVRPFWAAVLGYEERDGNLVDPARRGPPMWFQTTAEAAERTDRNRIHLDISVPDDVAEQRIQAALDAGGRLVTDRYARSWWVLADADGNEACICTWLDR